MSDDETDRRRARDFGREAEDRVADHFVSEGWTVLARNWRGGNGELDIVMERVGALRFVEVKARGPDDDLGLEAIDEYKRRRLVSAARAWLMDYEVVREVCFLAVLVELKGTDWVFTFVDNAFDA